MIVILTGSTFLRYLLLSCLFLLVSFLNYVSGNNNIFNELITLNEYCITFPTFVSRIIPVIVSKISEFHRIAANTENT